MQGAAHQGFVPQLAQLSGDEIDRIGQDQVLTPIDRPLVVAREGSVRGELPLPIAGLLSDAPLEEVAEGLERLQKLLRSQGVEIDAPFMTLSFLALSVIPSLKITDRGLVDV